MSYGFLAIRFRSVNPATHEKGQHTCLEEGHLKLDSAEVVRGLARYGIVFLDTVGLEPSFTTRQLQQKTVNRREAQAMLNTYSSLHAHACRDGLNRFDASVGALHIVVRV